MFGSPLTLHSVCIQSQNPHDHCVQQEIACQLFVKSVIYVKSLGTRFCALKYFY